MSALRIFALCTLLWSLLLVGPAFAQTETEATDPADAEQAPEAAEPAAEAEPATEVEPAVEAPEATPAEEPAASEAVAEPAVEEGGGMPGGTAMVVLSNRTTFGMLGSDLLAEYGFQIEVTSKHFGVAARWANFQPYPDNVDFCWDLGFVFHYYPFGDGPSGLYAGPGFTFAQIFQDPDPMRQAKTILRKWVVEQNLAENPPAAGTRNPPMDITDMGMIRLERTGYGHQFNLLTPLLEVGYRHTWPERESPVYFSLGIELTLGYAVSDSTRYWDSSFLWTLNPQIGLVW